MGQKQNKLRKALPADAGKIKSILNGYAEKGWMLPRSLSQIYEGIRDFWVADESGEVVGCVALQICWENMAEIRSLAVAAEKQRKGLGRALVQKCLNEASGLGIGQVFTLTFLPKFFEKLGFVEIKKETLPHKIWRDCLNCPHFPDCKEEALIIQLVQSVKHKKKATKR